MARPSYIKVDLAAMVSNYQWACSLAPKAKTMAIVKANAYGHGAVACAQALQDYAPAFGVACIEEALQLREAGIKQPILLLEGTFAADEIDIAAENCFWPTLENSLQCQAIVVAKISKPLHIWLKIDTGMHRLGLLPCYLPNVLTQLRASNNVRNDIVISSHFACADELNNPFTQRQIACFLTHLPTADMPFSLANSAGIMAWPDSHGTWNRAGYMLYGNTPLNVAHNSDLGLIPVMSLHSAVISTRRIAAGEGVGYTQKWTATRPSIIATVAIGYADGYPRHAPTGTPVLIKGLQAPLVGRVSMDLVTIDVTDIPGVDIGTPVCLWGKDLPVNKIAKLAGTIGYEIFTRMGQRLPLVYV